MAVDKRIGYLLKQAQHLARAVMDDALRDQGVNAPQYAALSLIADQPDQSSASLARHSLVTAQTMAGIIGQLASKGLVRRTAHDTNRQILTVAPTSIGLERLRECERITDEIEARMQAGFGPADEDAIRRLLRLCIDGLRTPPPGDAFAEPVVKDAEGVP